MNISEDKTNFYSLSREEVAQTLQDAGEPAFRADQVWQAVYKSQWEDPNQFFNIPNSTRKYLADHFSFRSLSPARSLVSSDKLTEKSLFITSSSSALETVLMRYENRRTLCISTQSGCAIGCVFCSTGQMGFFANLSSGEIVEQVLIFSRELIKKNEKLTNIVVMGMGEPFLNYENTMRAIDILNNPAGFGFGERRFTLSTSGIIPGIRRFTSEKRQINLAVSLHAPNDTLRSQLVPINKKYPLGDLLETCREYVSHTNRRISFEYALIQGVNDSPTLARELVNRIKGILCHVNLIQLNRSPAYQHQGSSTRSAREFMKVIETSGIPVTLRLRRGLDIQAGCGQLAYSKTENA